MNMPCNPLSNRRRPASGTDGVKMATGHADAGNQASHGNLEPSIQLKRAVPRR